MFCFENLLFNTEGYKVKVGNIILETSCPVNGKTGHGKTGRKLVK